MSDALPSGASKGGNVCGIVPEKMKNILWNGNSGTFCTFFGNDVTQVIGQTKDCIQRCQLNSACTHYSWYSIIVTSRLPSKLNCSFAFRSVNYFPFFYVTIKYQQAESLLL
jgi:hypothetical protein